MLTYYMLAGLAAGSTLGLIVAVILGGLRRRRGAQRKIVKRAIERGKRESEAAALKGEQTFAWWKTQQQPPDWRRRGPYVYPEEKREGKP